MDKRAGLTGADYLLLLLYIDNCSPIDSAIKLIKMMFLFDKEVKPILNSKGVLIDHLPQFIPYNYGPFSKDVYEQIELFKSIAFVSVKDLKNTESMDEVDDWEETSFIDDMLERDQDFRRTSDGKYYRYSLLSKGIEYVEKEILPQVDDEQLVLLTEYKKRIQEVEIKKLLRYVYVKYPEMTEKSKIKKEVLG